MFTGIVHGVGQVVHIEENISKTWRGLTVELPTELTSNLVTGASIANNGCCLTVVAIEHNKIRFDLIEETLKLTNLSTVSIGDWINIERAAKFGDEVGGHVMSGHISGQAEIKSITQTPDNCVMLISPPNNLRDYILYKGFIGIDGISLTVGHITNDGFYLHLIPETLDKTNLKQRCVGDWVNIEIDPQTHAIVNTVKQYLASH